MKKVLLTGSAGFIGSAIAIKLLDRGDKVIGIDNLNDYYDPNLKKSRLDRHIDHENYTHVTVDIADREIVKDVFEKYHIDNVINMAAQAGVRYSIENPRAYVDSNLVGFGNILEGCRNNKINHLGLCIIKFCLWWKYENTIFNKRLCKSSMEFLCSNKESK